MRVLKLADGAVWVVSLALFCAGILTSLMGTIARNVDWLPSLLWSTEFTAFAIALATLLAVPRGIRQGRQISVNALPTKLPSRFGVPLRLLSAVATVTFGAVVAYYGVDVAIINRGQQSPLMGLSLYYVYLVVAFAGALLVVEGVITAVRGAGFELIGEQDSRHDADEGSSE